MLTWELAGQGRLTGERKSHFKKTFWWRRLFSFTYLTSFRSSRLISYAVYRALSVHLSLWQTSIYLFWSCSFGQFILQLVVKHLNWYQIDILMFSLLLCTLVDSQITWQFWKSNQHCFLFFIHCIYVLIHLFIDTLTSTDAIAGLSVIYR